MPSLRPKPKRTSGWLPNQVLYGMDCSSDNPADWKPFGYLVDQEQLATQPTRVKDQPRSPSPER